MAQSHLSRPIGESSKIVPTLTENCFWQSRHFHIRRVLRNESLSAAQRGHTGPLEPHLAPATTLRHTWGSENVVAASIKLLGYLKLTDSMDPLYQRYTG